MIVIWLILRYQVIENIIHIGAYVRIRILVDSETAGCMLHKNIQQTGLGKRSGKTADDLARYQMTATPQCRQSEFYLLYHFRLIVDISYFRNAIRSCLLNTLSSNML